MGSRSGISAEAILPEKDLVPRGVVKPFFSASFVFWYPLENDRMSLGTSGLPASVVLASAILQAEEQ